MWISIKLLKKIVRHVTPHRTTTRRFYTWVLYRLNKHDITCSKYTSISFVRFNVLLIRVESLQFLQEDVTIGDGVVLIGHDEELEDGPSARPKEQDGPVSMGPGFCVHHNLIQLVPAEQERYSAALMPQSCVAMWES